MAQVVSERPYTLESSMFLTRPDLKTFLKPDTNVGETDVTKYNLEKAHTELHIPTSTGSLDYNVTCCDDKLTYSAPLPVTTKKRTDNRILDPLNNFISPAGEVMLRTGKPYMKSFGKARVEPQTTIPQNIHSIRANSEAIDELKRIREGVGEPELNWNSQKISDLVLKSRLGGWTSDDKNKSLSNIEINNPYRLRDIFPNMKIGYNDEQERDKLANRYLYTTSTQQMYGQVNWDSKVPKKLHAPITTNEFGKPDPLKKTDSTPNRPQLYQSITGLTWDRYQQRDSNFIRQPVSFTAPTRRGNQLPGYSGHIGGRNLQHMDDVVENFKPLTVLRTKQPKEPEPNYKPNIPGYTGHFHQFKTNSVSHYDDYGRPYTTTAAFHREMPSDIFKPVVPEASGLAGDFSIIQTKVPPQNPYDNIKRPIETGINNSIDHIKHPIVNSKETNHQSFLIKKEASKN